MHGIPPYAGKCARAVAGGAYLRCAAFPALPGVDEGADAGPSAGDGLDAAVADAVDGDPETAPITVLDIESGARDRVSDDLDEDVLDDAPIGGQLQPAALGGLPKRAGLSDREAAYARAARAGNTPRGYRSDWTDFTTWCRARYVDPMPAGPAALTGYLVALAQAGAKVGTLSRRLSTIKFARTSAGHPDPATHPRVMAVWEGIRRVHGAPPEQASPPMPPLLFDVLAAARSREPGPHRPLPLPRVGAQSQRCEHPSRICWGRVTGRCWSGSSARWPQRAHRPGRRRCRRTPQRPGTVPAPVEDQSDRRARRARRPALRQQPRPLSRPRNAQMARARRHHRRPSFPRRDQNQPRRRAAPAPRIGDHPGQGALARTGAPTTGYSGHSLRAGFVTYAHLRGSSDRAIAHQTRHRSMASLGGYARVSHAWTDNAATGLGL